MKRSRKTTFPAEETARYRPSGRTELGMFSDLQELQAGGVERKKERVKIKLKR